MMTGTQADAPISFAVIEPVGGPTLTELASGWQAARFDGSDGTMQTYRVALGRLLPRFGERTAAELEPARRCR